MIKANFGFLLITKVTGSLQQENFQLVKTKEFDQSICIVLALVIVLQAKRLELLGHGIQLGLAFVEFTMTISNNLVNSFRDCLYEWM